MRTLLVVGAERPTHLLERLSSRGHDVVVRTAADIFDASVAGFDLALIQGDADRTKALAAALVARGCTALLFLAGEAGSTRELEELLAAGFVGYVTLAGSACDFSIACAEKAARERATVAQLATNLRVSEARYRAVVASMHEGVVLCGADGTILTCNAPAEKILGLAKGDILEWTTESQGFTFIREDGSPFPSEELPARVALRTGVPVVNAVVGAARFGGATVWLRMTAFPITWDEGSDRPQGVVATFSDLTKRRALEAQLRMADRLAAVGRLAATVGHEINNPLAYVIGNLDALAARGLTPGSETARLVADARDGAERVRRIVRDLKVFARNEPDGVGPLDVRRVLDSAISMASNEIRHRARLVRDFGDVRAVVANESRLGQVFLNLLVNAAQATRAGDVQGNEIRVTTRATGDRVTVEIRDTGVGIAPALIDRIFDPYFTTRPDAVGTGLGLSICHSLVTGIGGTIDVESEVGKGSVFRVALPASDEKPRDESHPPPASSPERKQRILIVDDEPRLAVTLKMLLRDHDVEVADGGRRALERIERDRAFDVLLCDLMMVDVDGVEVYERVRASVPGLEQRIIFMTGGAFTSRASEFLASIPNVCLEKPFPVEELLSAVRRTLKRIAA
jgi:two-component system, cell cycle sensor histidine kinase and response regulator CckA